MNVCAKKPRHAPRAQPRPHIASSIPIRNRLLLIVAHHSFLLFEILASPIDFFLLTVPPFLTNFVSNRSFGILRFRTKFFAKCQIKFLWKPCIVVDRVSLTSSVILISNYDFNMPLRFLFFFFASNGYKLLDLVTRAKLQLNHSSIDRFVYRLFICNASMTRAPK